MEFLRSSSFAIGICIGLIFCVIIFRFANRNKKLKSEYDERQLQIRGRSYMFAFYAVVIYEALMTCLSIGGILKSLPVEEYVFHACSIYVGAIVLCVHSVWNGAYWGLNNNIRRYVGIFIALFILNLFPIVGVLANGVKTVDGYIDFPFINLACTIMLVVLAITLLIRRRMDSKAEGQEECL
ncbi:MAG: hypothetical protein IK152_10500 [Lachnospiraceae bacterium]|nr:hypothetical protein [Lachnospiraceae bacterium]